MKTRHNDTKRPETVFTSPYGGISRTTDIQMFIMVTREHGHGEEGKKTGNIAMWFSFQGTTY